ncbi:hypothetical protein [Moheibacter sediminis]|nr:hypothetical protein [Moheibacter sediminis]
MKNTFRVLIVLTVFSCKENVEDAVEPNFVSDTVHEIHNEPNPKEKFDLPFEIEGEYSFENDVADCKMSLNIFSVKGILKYELKTRARNVNGDAEISKEDNEQYYLTFKNIEWNESKGFIDPEGNMPEENLPIPTEIMAGLRDNQIIFQNYGNAENYYVILKECDVKFIYFEKV